MLVCLGGGGKDCGSCVFVKPHNIIFSKVYEFLIDFLKIWYPNRVFGNYEHVIMHKQIYNKTYFTPIAVKHLNH